VQHKCIAEARCTSWPSVCCTFTEVLVHVYLSASTMYESVRRCSASLRTQQGCAWMCPPRHCTFATCCQSNTQRGLMQGLMEGVRAGDGDRIMEQEAGGLIFSGNPL
jgi:hypothetical protein